ncbi:MAG: hypothetical protein ACFFFT_11220 [Candidatus Thorarchaeota archaeon]
MIQNQNKLSVIISFIVINFLVIFQLSIAQKTKPIYAKNELKDIGIMVSQLEKPEIIMNSWTNYIEREAKTGKTLDLNSLIQDVFLEANLERNRQLEIQMAEVMQKCENIEKIKEEMAKLEEQLNTLDEMTQMDLLKLQQAMEKQQQYLQMIASVMKSMHDTAKSIIQNLR